MRSIAGTITVVAAALMITAVPIFAQEGVMGQQELQVQKSECLLVAKNCPTDSIQERIERIRNEIGRGTAIYTSDELRRLNRELEEAQKFLDYEMTNGG
jgi:hypothetical protein